MSSLALPNFELANRCESNSYAKDMHDNGYIIVKDIFETDLIDRLAKWNHEFFRDKADDSVPSSLKIQDAALFEPLVAQLGSHPKILKLLKDIYGRKPIPFQTLNFYKGSELATHSDTIHFNSIPQRWMCGVWVALEDVTVESGALHYYPGSHKMPTLDTADTSSTLVTDEPEQLYTAYRNNYIPAIKELIELSGLKKEIFLPKKGDCLVWSANLLHGGDPILNRNLTRLSQVTHYFFENCKYYTPLMSDPASGKIFWRENIRDICNTTSSPAETDKVYPVNRELNEAKANSLQQKKSNSKFKSLIKKIKSKYL